MRLTNLKLKMGRRMADSLSGWVKMPLGKGMVILGRRGGSRFLSQSVLLSSASGLCFWVVLLSSVACTYCRLLLLCPPILSACR